MEAVCLWTGPAERDLLCRVAVGKACFRSSSRAGQISQRRICSPPAQRVISWLSAFRELNWGRGLGISTLSKCTFTKPACFCKAPQAAIGCFCLLSVAVSRLPQNFVAWNNHFILLTIRRVRSLVARLGGVSLITQPWLVQLGWRVHLHAGFYSCGMAALPPTMVSHSPGPFCGLGFSQCGGLRAVVLLRD